jgi:IPT/TIG domain
MLPRRLLSLAAVAAVLVAMPLTASGRHAAPGTASAAPRSAERGLVYRGLHASDPQGPCAGVAFELRDARGRVTGCTHGPDPAPLGVDVAAVRTTAMLRAATAPTSASTHTVPCVGSGKDGNRVQAIYAHVQGKTDRFNAVAPLIRTWAAQVNDTYNASAAETAGSRQIRFVTKPVTGGCTLSVLDIAVPSNVVQGQTGDITISGFLRSKGLGGPARKNLVWMDATGILCGIGDSIPDTSPTQGNMNNGGGSNPFSSGMTARTDTDCWGQLEEPFNSDPGSVEAHELTHTMGAVQGNAPNHTNNFHCSDEFDVMCYDDDFNPNTFPLRHICTFLHSPLLDCNHNDYFSTKPAAGSYLTKNWNTASNSFLVANLAPGNDKFPNAEPMTPAGLYVGSNRLATKETGESSVDGAPAAHSVWYQIKAPSNGTLAIDTNGSSFNTVVGVYTGSASSSVGNLHEEASNDNAHDGVTYSRVSTPAVKGKTYWVKVDGKAGAQGAILLHASLAPKIPAITGMSPASGPPGTTVTLTGTDFDGFFVGLNTTFDGKSLAGFPNISGDNKSLTFKVPAGTKTGSLVLRSDSFTVVSDTFRVT